MAEFVDQLHSLKEKGLEKYARLSGREKSLLVLALLLAIVLPSFVAIKAAIVAFREQSSQLHQASEDVEGVVRMLSAYQRLRVKKDALEKRLAANTSPVPIRSYLETIARDKVGLKNTPIISEVGSDQFDSRYLNTTVRITFDVSSPEQLVKFLREIEEGDQALIISEIELNRGRRRKPLEVKIKVHSITQKAPSEA